MPENADLMNPLWIAGTAVWTAGGAIWLTTLVLGFVRRNGRNGQSGQRSVEFWQQSYGEITEKSLVPVIHAIERSQQDTRDYRAEAREDHQAIRAHIHAINDTLQGIVSGLEVLKDRMPPR